MPKEKLLRPVHPNAGIESDYRRQLDKLIRGLHDAVLEQVSAAYKTNEPRITQDETPAEALRKVIQRLSRDWLKRFDVGADRLARYFAQSVEKRSSAALRKILKDAGLSVEFRMTAAMRDVVGATVNANVALIKSIPQQYLSDVEGIVMRSVQTGRDLGQVSKDLQARYGITRRRAAFIARDQNNKATAAMATVRKLEVGLDEEVWVHSGGAKHPRPTHVAAGRQRIRYKIATGWYDPSVKRHVRPGEEPGCGCVGRPVVKGFS